MTHRSRDEDHRGESCSYPERTAALVAVDGALRHMFTLEMVEGMVAPMRADGYQDTVTQMIAGMAGGGLADEDVRGITEMALATPQRTMVDAVLATADPAMWSDEPIRVPLLALLVEQPTWNADYKAAIKQLAPQLDWVMWQNVSHFLMLERPAEFQAELSRFLAFFPASAPPASAQSRPAAGGCNNSEESTSGGKHLPSAGCFARLSSRMLRSSRIG